MPAVPPAPQRPRTLEVAPLRALRFATDDASALVAPPYDLLEPLTLADLRRRHPHNVVRLTMPAGEDPQTRGRDAARTLDAWRAAGVVRRDEVCALYVLRTRTPDGHEHLGLVGTVALPDEESGAVLPHEDVMPGPVADRLALTRATALQAEPILLVHGHAPRAAAVLEAATAAEPLSAARLDNVDYTLWRITDPGDVAAVTEDLAAFQALIADGHHRFETARQLARATGEPVGIVAVLVDETRWPLRVGAIHRTVAGLDLDTALARLEGQVDVRRAGPSDGRHGDRPPEVPRGELVLVSGAPGSEAVSIRPRDLADWVRRQPGHLSHRRRELEASLLHEVVLPVWGADEADVTYHHSALAAVSRAAEEDGLAVLLPAVTTAEVHQLAAEGELMPRKSTSFSPKPPSGLVMRELWD